jgi:hypothetical protein
MKGVHDCLAAPAELAQCGIEAEVIDLRRAGAAPPAAGSDEELGVVLCEDPREVVPLAGVEGLDQLVDPRGHHEQVARRGRDRVPVAVRRSPPDEQGLPRSDLMELPVDPEAESTLEDEPGLVIGAVKMEAGDRAPWVEPGVGPVRDHERLANDHGAARLAATPPPVPRAAVGRGSAPLARGQTCR